MPYPAILVRVDSPGSHGPAASSLIDAAVRLIRASCTSLTNLTIVRELGSGYTEAEVAVVDLQAESPQLGVLDGQFVVKASSPSGDPQGPAHVRFVEDLHDFSTEHVPNLIGTVQGSEAFCDIYEVAGLSLHTVRSADALDYETLQRSCAACGGDLLRAQLSAHTPPDYATSVTTTASEWLGQEFHQEPARLRYSDIEGSLNSLNQETFAHVGEVLPNPFVLFDTDAIAEVSTGILRGRAHGDLHLRNLLVKGSASTHDLQYWLIDVNWADQAPLLYDQAYLEIAAILHGHKTTGSKVLLPILSAADGKRTAASVIPIDLREQGILELVRQLRTAVVDVLQELHPGRRDVWNQQYLLARVCAGLNWARKPIQTELRKAAYIYAAWAAKILLETYFPIAWASILTSPKANNSTSPISITRTVETDAEEASKAQEEWSNYRLARQKYLDIFLISDGPINSSQTTPLASAPWNVVFDLDPDSDLSGLSSRILQIIGDRRTINIFGKTPAYSDPGSVTHWFMADGWTTHAEPRSRTFASWRRDYLPEIRRIVQRVVVGTPNQSAAVLVLRSGTNDDAVNRIIEYIEECYGDSVHFVDLSDVPQDGQATALQGFLSALTEMDPSPTHTTAPSLPGTTGRVQIAWNDLRRLSVDLDVLHSHVLTEELSDTPDSDAFWRGRPPTWLDLDAGLDVERDIMTDLSASIVDALTANKNIVLELAHAPGAGATTLARRVAWNLKDKFPAVAITRYSPDTSERIAEIFHHTGLPVFVVAEAADITESEREDLLDSLRDGNIRAVFLVVTRTRGKRAADFELYDPMSAAEASRFATVFAGKAKTSAGKERIEALRSDSASDKIGQQYLSPFFFGLYAFDDDFELIPSYVDSHLKGLGYAARKLALYLALATRYSQVGIPTALVAQWVGATQLVNNGTPSAADADGEDPLALMLDPELRHLVVDYQNSLRLLHPTVAEEVIRVILGAGDGKAWRAGLAEASVDFISQVCAHLGSESLNARKLLTQIFIRRTRWAESFGVSRKTRGANFAEIIVTMPSPESAHWVLQRLTEECPDEPHFWNHLGRHNVYEMKLDYAEAESCLLRAVELSGEKDPLHFHTLGLVRRFWVEQRTAGYLRIGEPTASGLLELVGDLVEEALESFRSARELSPSQEYNYITPVQLITYMVGQIVRVSNCENLAEFLSGDGTEVQWVTSHVGLAEELLDQLRTVRASRSDSRHYAGCVAKLDALYGNIDAVIDQWRSLLEDSEEKTSVGLVLARMYFARSGRDWSGTSETDLRQMERLYGDSLSFGNLSDTTLRNWFQSYRRLPEYSEARALERFASVAGVSESLEAHYYLYVLHWLRWLRNDERDLDAVRFHLDECRRLSRGRRRQWSYEWLATAPSWCPLAHFSQLGRWDRERDFFTNESPLAHQRGFISQISSGRSGRIRIGDGSVEAFFVPGVTFLRTRDVNGLVVFYLGFSYEGLRAWRVEDPTSDVGITQGRVPGSGAPTPAAPSALRPPTDLPGSVAHHEVDRADIAKGTFLAILERLIQEGDFISLAAFGAKVVDQMGTDDYRALTERYGRLGEMIRQTGLCRIERGQILPLHGD